MNPRFPDRIENGIQAIIDRTRVNARKILVWTLTPVLSRMCSLETHIGAFLERFTYVEVELIIVVAFD